MGHCSHRDAALPPKIVENEPRAHGWHAVKAEVSPYEPGRHSSHALELKKEPRGQELHAVAPLLELNPAAHPAHAEAPYTGAYVPAEQTPHELSPVLDPYAPAEHDRQPPSVTQEVAPECVAYVWRGHDAQEAEGDELKLPGLHRAHEDC